jgi:hypothetical protein
MKREDVEVTRFPIVRLGASDRKVVDQQERLRYPMTFDREAEPEEFRTVGVGKLLRVGAFAPPAGKFRANVYFENTVVTGYRTIWVARRKKYMIPTFHTDRIAGTRVYELGKWHILGEMPKAREVKDHRVFLVRVRRDGKR